MPLALCLSGTRANEAVLLGPLGGARGGDERARPCDEGGQRSVRLLMPTFWSGVRRHAVQTSAGHSAWL